MKAQVDINFYTYYDDGSGNACFYRYCLANAYQFTYDAKDAWIPLTISPKLFSGTKTLTAVEKPTTGSTGSPPAYSTRTVTLDSTLKVSAIGSHETLNNSSVYANYIQFKLITVDQTDYTQFSCLAGLVDDIVDFDSLKILAVQKGAAEATLESQANCNEVIEADAAEVVNANDYFKVTWLLSDTRVSAGQLIIPPMVVGESNLFTRTYSGGSLQSAIKLAVGASGIAMNQYGPALMLAWDRFKGIKMSALQIPYRGVVAY